MSAPLPPKAVRVAPARSPSTHSSRRRNFKAIAAGATLIALYAAAWLATRFDPLGHARDDFEHRRYIAALGAAEDYLRRWPGNARASLMAARCATQMGQWKRAEGHFAHAGTLGIDDFHDRAYGMVRMQQPQRALELYGQLLERQPNDALALKRMAAVLMGLKRYSKLPELADRLMAIPGEEVAGRTLSGIAHHVDGRYPEAAETFLKVLSADPELKSMPLPTTLFWNHLATDLLAQGKFAEARTQLLRGLADTQDAGLTELLGTTYQQEGQADEAERYWRLAIERDPNLPAAWLDLGQLAITRHRPEEAVALLSRAVVLDPEAVEPNQNLSLAYKLLGKFEEAEKYRKVATDLRTRNLPTHGASRDSDPAVAASADERQR